MPKQTETIGSVCRTHPMFWHPRTSCLLNTQKDSAERKLWWEEAVQVTKEGKRERERL